MQKLFLFIYALYKTSRFKKAVVSWTFYIKKVFLEISQNSQENTSSSASFLIKLETCNLAYWKSQTQDPMTTHGTQDPRVGP